MQNNQRIRIALQKSGRLSDESIEILKRCGIKFRKNSGQLFHHCENFPADILLVRDDDIPNLVLNNTCDYGIVGTNVLQEMALTNNAQQNNRYAINQTLNFGDCRLAIAVPKEFDYQNLSSLAGKRIASSHPNLLQQFLVQQNINADIISLTGCVEIAPRLNLADAICDLVSTGATLEANHLKEVVKVFASKAVLIKSQQSNAANQEIATLFEQRIAGVMQASESKYIMLHAPKEKLKQIVALLPGAEHPTIMQLENDAEKVGLHAVCRENIFWETLEKLKLLGASSILVLPIEKMLA